MGTNFIGVSIGNCREWPTSVLTEKRSKGDHLRRKVILASTHLTQSILHATRHWLVQKPRLFNRLFWHTIEASEPTFMASFWKLLEFGHRVNWLRFPTCNLSTVWYVEVECPICVMCIGTEIGSKTCPFSSLGRPQMKSLGFEVWGILGP